MKYNREILMDAARFVEAWAKPQPRVGSDSMPRILIDHDREVRAYNLHIKKKNAEEGTKHPGIKPQPRYMLEAALELYLQEQPIIKRQELAGQFVCEKEDLSTLAEWVKAVTGKDDRDAFYIMAHWCWLVKRNLLGLPVVYHIMPIVTSPAQGGGKSTAVKKLVTPLADLMLELKIPQIVDERSFTMFQNYVIGFLDEMAGAEKVEVADFKRNVTSSTLTYRPMRTNAQVKIQNLCSFIGASNNDVFEVIKDTTGLRRFFPINAQDKLDHNIINGLDYKKLWRGIDETKERGYFELVQDTVAVTQDNLTMKDDLLLFLKAYSVPIENPEKVRVIHGKMLYNEYRVYCESNRCFVKSAQFFYKKLRQLGYESEYKRDENKVFSWYFKINSECPIFIELKVVQGGK